SLLKKEGEKQVDDFIVKAVLSIMPRGMLQTNDLKIQISNASAEGTSSNAPPPEGTNESGSAAGGTVVPIATAQTATPESTNRSDSLSPVLQERQVVEARRLFARYIHEFIRNTRSGTLGATGSVALIFIAIGLLGRIEDTFNDIWGVARGRNWFIRIVLYWGVIALLPVLLATALGLASGPHLESTKKFLTAMPFLSSLIFQVLPVVV